jgi:hydrogenase nickel incorporation protein HypA/HybF
MHELSVTQSLVDLAIEKAQEAGAARIVSLSLVIGDLTGVVEDSVRFYFDFIAKDTIAEGATIAFRAVPAQARCRDCGTSYICQEGMWACPQCQSTSAEITGGRELFLESIEVDGDEGDKGPPEHPGG